jgi:hypothetical protein
LILFAGAKYLDIIHHAHAPILSLFFDGFDVIAFFSNILMKSLPEQWPSDVRSYVYDFSILYSISANLDVINDKMQYMPDNILAYGPLSYLFFYLLAKINIITSLVIYRLISNLLLFCLLFAVIYSSFSESCTRFFRWSISLFLVVVLLLISTPLYYFNSSGNIEIYLFILCLFAFIIAEKKPKIAAVIFAVAAAIKYYPVLFLLIFIKRRRYDCFLIGAALSAILFFMPIFLLEGTFLENLLFILGEIIGAAKICAFNQQVFCHDGSLSIAFAIYNLDLAYEIKNILYQVSIVLILISAFFIFFRIEDEIFAFLPLITAFCLVTQVSVFYKLSYLLIPLLLDRDVRMIPEKIISYILIALALSPIPFYFKISISNMAADFSFLLVLIQIATLFYAVRYGDNSFFNRFGLFKKFLQK